MEIRLDCGNFIIGDYTIEGNYDDGYAVYKTEAWEDFINNYTEDDLILYSNKSLENCIVWCLNS